MTTSNYKKTRITLDDEERKTLDEAVDLLYDMWKAAPKKSNLEKEMYDAYSALFHLCTEAVPDGEGNLYWKEEAEEIE